MSGAYLQMIAAIYVVLGIFMIRASRDPENHRSLISFTIWSSLVHAGVMGMQALGDGQETNARPDRIRRGREPG